MLSGLPDKFAADGIALSFAGLHFSSVETGILAAAFATALISIAGLWRIGISEYRQARLKIVHDATLREVMGDQEREPQPSRLAGILAESLLVKLVGRKQLLTALMTAGFRGRHDFAIAIACKAGGAILLTAIAWSLGIANPTLHWTTVGLSFLIGLFAPEFVLARLAARRKDRLERAIPDALDLLVICAEAGLAMQPAVEEVSRTLQRSAPEIAAEFTLTSAELRVLPDRATAFENLAERTGIESLRGVVATLNQSMRFGTSLAESLRVLSAEMRAARLARIEEGAARLPVLLAIPLMIFLMPALLIVIMSPVALKVIDVFTTMGAH